MELHEEMKESFTDSNDFYPVPSLLLVLVVWF